MKHTTRTLKKIIKNCLIVINISITSFLLMVDDMTNKGIMLYIILALCVSFIWFILIRYFNVLNKNNFKGFYY